MDPDILKRADERLMEWRRSLTEPRPTRAEESQRLVSLLILGSIVGALALVVVIAWFIGAPFLLAVFVALFFLCLDAVAIAIVWYGGQRRH